ncbi:MAG: hypothetical protein Q4D38_00240 [Planctomycetia bacterium]|nr:hypothetical protein [Planctomycetia bacterium]
MENQSKRPKLDRSKSIDFVSKILGAVASPLRGLSAFRYAMETANYGETLFRSRFPEGTELCYPDIDLRAEIGWHASLLSFAQLYGRASYEDILRISNSELAGCILLLNPDMRMPLDSRVLRYISNLSQATDELKLAAMARTLTAVNYIGEEATDYPPAILYELAYYVKHFQAFSPHSDFTLKEWQKACHCINSWYLQEAISRHLPRLSTVFSLDSDRRLNQLRELVEV